MKTMSHEYHLSENGQNGRTPYPFVKSSRMCVKPATRENRYSSPQRGGGRLGSLIFFPRKCQTTYMNPTTTAETKNRPRNECVNPRWWANPNIGPLKLPRTSRSDASAANVMVAVARAV